MSKSSHMLIECYRAYGGLGALVKSPYLGIACILSVFTFGLVLYGEWWELILQIIPALIGFSLAATALIFGIGDKGFLKLLMQTRATREKKAESHSIFVSVLSLYIHFIVVQVVTLSIAIMRKAFAFPAPAMLNKYVLQLHYGELFIGYLGILLLWYSIILVIACALGLFHFVCWHNDYITTTTRQTDLG